MKTVSVLILLCFLPGFNSIDAQLPDTIKIGLLISDKNAPAALHGAELAIRKSNEKAAYRGHHFKIVARSMEGPWGTGSREAAGLIFKEKVLAVIGSHDGRNAHIVEQVTTKAGVVFLSAWPGDPSLSQAFSPWYFSCVPNDLQQADILINEVYGKMKYKNLIIVADNGYDSEQAVKSFILRMQTTGYQNPGVVRYNDKTDPEQIADQITEKNPQGVIFFGEPSPSVKIMNLLREKRSDCRFYGSLSLMDENRIIESDLKNFENVVLVSPQFWLTQAGIEFTDQFRASYNNNPGVVAAYAYDAVNMMVEAIIKSGMDIEKIQKTLMGIKYNGITGLIQFDERGNRKPPFKLIEVKNGKPVAYEH